jgi:hypothetical protein
MGHGDRWKVVAGDTGSAFAHYAPRLVQTGQVVAGAKRRFVLPAEDQAPERPIVTVPVGMYLSEGPFGFCSISLLREEKKSFSLMTAYPMPLNGIVRPLIITEVKQDCLGLEGWIDAETESGIPLSFFATDYFVHPERYCKDSLLQVSLSGLAYRTVPPVTPEFLISDPTTLYRFRVLEEPPDGPVRITTKDAAVLLSLEGWEPFDYRFQGPIKRSDRFVLGSRGFHQCVVTVIRHGDDDIDVSILAADEANEGANLTAGSMVNGAMCIMGQLADHRWPAMT